MRRADLAALAALLACASLAAAARAPGSDACVLLRLRDRNMAYIERTAEAAAGLSGPRAGAYLRAEDVAALAGRSESELAELADVLRQLGGRLQAMGQLRDLAVACFPAAAIPGLAAASASASASQSALQRELAAATQRVIDAQRAACAAPSAEAAFAAEALVLALPPKVAGARVCLCAFALLWRDAGQQRSYMPPTCFCACRHHFFHTATLAHPAGCSDRSHLLPAAPPAGGGGWRQHVSTTQAGPR